MTKCRRWTARLIVASATLALGALPALAQDGFSPYHISPGDVLAINAYGDPSLTGQFPVGDDGAIGYPMLGSLKVAGMTPPEVGAAITSALAEHIAGATASVSVSAYAPVFILGDVAKPGSYQFRPGMVTLELLALGGGLSKPDKIDSSLDLQAISARQDYADLSLNLFSLAVKRARIQAERDHIPFVYQLAPDTSTESRAVRQGIIDAESYILETRLKTLKTEEDGLAAQQAGFEQEIASIKESVALHDEEIALLVTDMDTAKSMLDRGLSTAGNYRNAQREVSVTRRDALELRSAEARANQSLLDLGLRRLQLENTRSKEIADDLRDIDVEVARTQQKMQSALATIGELASLEYQPADGIVAPSVHYSIMRIIDGVYTAIPADDLTPVRPGDILKTSVSVDAARTTKVAG